MADYSIEVIAPDGDVVFVVGTAEQEKLQVSSGTMSSISPVFKALLGPHFREGQQRRSSSNPVLICLPDDVGDHMYRLCVIAHLKTERNRESLNCKDILGLAVLIDKYDCLASLQPQCAGILLSWLLTHPPGHESFTRGSIWRIALAAYLMGCPQAFKDSTEKIIVHTTGTPPPRVTKSLPCLPFSVIASINQRRNTARLNICNDIPRLGIPHCSWWCANGDAKFMQALADAYRILFWPPNFGSEAIPLSDAFEKISNMPSIGRAKPNCEHTPALLEVSGAKFREAAHRLRRQCVGLCLECVRLGVTEMHDICKDH